MGLTRREIIIAVAGFVAASVLMGGGLWWHARSGQKAPKAGAQTVGDHTISLNQTPAADSGGLSVSSSGASDLGQLGGDQSGQDSGGGSSGSGGSGGVDSSTFAQYDKYKSNKSALFGDIKKGTGAELTAGRTASVYYKGWLTDGTLFDQSRTNSAGQLQAFTFTLGAHKVIPGWEEGLAGMKASGERLVIVPPAVGYGSQGQGPIPPNAIMIFDVKLVSVK